MFQLIVLLIISIQVRIVMINQLHRFLKQPLIYLESQNNNITISIQVVPMGGVGATKSEQNLLRDYTVIQQNNNEKYKFLQHKNTEEEYLLKQYTFTNVKQCNKMMQKLGDLKLKLNGNKNLVEVKDYLMVTEQMYCGSFFKIFVLWQYPQRTLDDQICERRLNKSKFTEGELWSIIASCVGGLCHLQKNNIRHETLRSSNIILSREGIVKTSDPSALGLPTNYQSLLTKRSTKHVYPSPQQCKSLAQELIYPSYNSYKSDVFTFGIIIMQVALLECQDQLCYQNEKLKINWDSIKYNLSRMRDLYSNQIVETIQLMLELTEGTRPDWIIFSNIIEKGNLQTTSMNQISNDMKSVSSKPKTYQSNYDNGSIKQQSEYEQKTSLIPPIFIHIPTRKPQEKVNHFGSYSQNQNHQIHLPHSYNENKYCSTQRSPRSSNQYQNTMVKHPGRVTFNGNNNPVNSRLIKNDVLMKNPSLITLRPFKKQQLNQNVMQKVVQVPLQATPMAGIKTSLIENTRPLRNFFPKDTYTEKTCADSNPIIIHNSEETFPTLTPSGPTKFSQRKNSEINEDRYQQKLKIQSFQLGQGRPSQDQDGIQNIFQTPSYKQQQNISLSKDYLFSQSNINQQKEENPSYLSQQFYKQSESVQQTDSHQQLEYVSEQYHLGSRYQGYKLKGLRHGQGRFYYQDGGMYDGQWKFNKMDGFGKLYYQSDKLAYEGYWKEQQFSGKGIIYNQQPEVLKTGFNYKDFDELDEYWLKYQGQFEKDSKNGRGTLYLTNGEKFQGQFKEDFVDGNGVFYCKNGRIITGVWKQNQKIA